MISIIIPVYNAESYIIDCLNSITQQKTVFEIICINDGSTDNSLDIIENYRKKDQRIRIFSQTNQGLSSARNKGIELSKSEYIMFVDADDYISKNAISQLTEFIQKNKFDLILFNFSLTEPINESDEIEIESTNKTRILEGVLSMEISTSACFCIISKNIFHENRIEFPLKKYYEDAFTLHKIIHYSNTPCKIKNIFYFYRTTPGSITNSTDKNKIDDLFSSIDEIYEYINYLDYPNYYYLAEGRFCILVNISLKKINQDWFDNKLFTYFLQKTIHACIKYRISNTIIYTFFYTTFKLNFTYFEILSDTFSRLLIKNYTFKSFLVNQNNINCLFDFIEIQKSDKVYFWGKNSVSDSILKKSSIENFGGYIRGDFSHIESIEHQVLKLSDLNFDDRFTVIIFSIYSAHVIKQRILNLKHYNPVIHQVLNYNDLLSFFTDPYS